MTQDLVLYETDAKVGFVTLNRPEKLNALSMDLRRELAVTLTRADEDPATSVVVVRGAGRSFCVGYDLAGGSGSEAWRHDAIKYHERLGTSLALELMPWYMRKPVLPRCRGTRSEPAASSRCSAILRSRRTMRCSASRKRDTRRPGPAS
jgi:enoyl-CoA hydratase